MPGAIQPLASGAAADLESALAELNTLQSEMAAMQAALGVLKGSTAVAKCRNAWSSVPHRQYTACRHRCESVLSMFMPHALPVAVASATMPCTSLFTQVRCWPGPQQSDVSAALQQASPTLTYRQCFLAWLLCRSASAFMQHISQK